MCGWPLLLQKLELPNFLEKKKKKFFYFEKITILLFRKNYQKLIFFFFFLRNTRFPSKITNFGPKYQKYQKPGTFQNTNLATLNWPRNMRVLYSGFFFHRSKISMATQNHFFKNQSGSFLNFWRIFWFSQIFWRNFSWCRI